MSKTIEAVFDGMVFRPLEPVELAPNSRVQITIATAASSIANLASLARAAGTLNPSVNNDGSQNADEWGDLDKYIYENYIYSSFNQSPK